MASNPSPFLYPGPISTADTLSIVHLKRDLQLPTLLREHDEDDEGYTEGKVVNTRFGSFPHKTLIGVPWGTQIRASKVDTGSRGRRDQEHKRKREESEVTDISKARKLDSAESPAGTNTSSEVKGETEAVAASSGFVHLLPPTPENWTSSLPHRTQVVYTPDYSYILHRLRARPGTSIIEAGAGSGSFTHASARAVFHGYPSDALPPSKKRKLGKVWSYEFHEQRHEKLQVEIKDHGLEGIVQITHRDVCENGFLVEGESPNAEAIFLDLPAPWLALPHLVRSPPRKPAKSSISGEVNAESESGKEKEWKSPLNPNSTVYLCTFSPCIEQVQRTISAMRQLGWVDIEMVQLSQKRFEIRRERIGIDNGAQRGLSTTPASVEEALARLIEVEGNFQTFHENGSNTQIKKANGKGKDKGKNPNGRDKILESLVERKVFKEGKLVSRTEPEVKVHTSYLVFAVLPMEWTEEDERKANEVWEGKVRMDDDVEDGDGVGRMIGMSKRQIKKAERAAMKERVAKAEAEKSEEAISSDPKIDGSEGASIVKAGNDDVAMEGQDGLQG